MKLCDDAGMSEQEMLDWIDQQTYKTLLAKWRHHPAGCPFFVARTDVFEHYQDAMENQKRAVGALAYRISKEVGW